MILPSSSGLPSSSSSSRRCPGCWDSSSSPPSARPCCDKTPPRWSPTKRTAPLWTPTPTTGPSQMRGRRRRCLPTAGSAPCSCPPQASTWPKTPTSFGCWGPPTRRCPPCLTWRSVTCCWTRQCRHQATRFPFSASARTVKARWGPKERPETGAPQVCGPL